MFRALANLFVNAFGITKPVPEQEQRTGIIIAAAVLGVIAMLALAALALFRVLS